MREASKLWDFAKRVIKGESRAKKCNLDEIISSHQKDKWRNHLKKDENKLNHLSSQHGKENLKWAYSLLSECLHDIGNLNDSFLDVRSLELVDIVNERIFALNEDICEAEDILLHIACLSNGKVASDASSFEVCVAFHVNSNLAGPKLNLVLSK